MDGNGLALRKTIDIGARSLSAVEINAGLNEGDMIVISSIDQFRSAESVLITD
jgi:HlyD family secretion protein